ncbi:hypothetical protein GL218_04112 [Daldinia childiae]|uniref:uncharacterized protein n=1 Tax=Daldinia childiae TaxID=326645 RepID=UPI00144803D4|nr:uncharacterized protein GL218_04112 [Daldinia childiae]KAF3061156.1 hypothetical protein GL218_04112 [Daldinia childiae]
MAGKKGGDSSKKAAGQARKAQTAAGKAAAEDAKKAAEEAADWDRGAKNNSKKEAQEAKKAEQARKKAEKEALAAEEEKSLPTRPGPKNSKTAVKKTNRIPDLPELDEINNKELPTQGGSGINAAINTLGLVLGEDTVKLDRHVDRRVGAAFRAFKERREKEMKDEGTKLNFSQRRDQIKDEFAKSKENPRNSTAGVSYNATKEEIAALKKKEMDRIEGRYDDSE